MTPLTKLLAATVVSAAALAGPAPAQYLPTRPGVPTGPALTLPPGVRPVPTLSPAVPSILPGGCFPTPRPPFPFPNPGPFPPPAVDIDYKVFYRVGPGYRWQYYGRAESGREARRVERFLEAQGYQVDLVETFARAPGR